MATIKELNARLKQRGEDLRQTHSTIDEQQAEIERLSKQLGAFKTERENQVTLPNGDLWYGVNPDRGDRSDTFQLSALDKKRSEALWQKLHAEAATGDPLEADPQKILAALAAFGIGTGTVQEPTQARAVLDQTMQAVESA